MSLKSESKDSKMSNYSNRILSIQTNTKKVTAYKVRNSSQQNTPDFSNSPREQTLEQPIANQMIIVN